MRDWKSELKKIELNTVQSSGFPEPKTDPKSDIPLSYFEEFDCARKRLVQERLIPTKKRDFELVVHLERRVQYFQKLHQAEISQYRQQFPGLAPEQLSKKAMALRASELLIEENAKSAEIARLEAESKALLKQEKLLDVTAKRHIQSKSLILCRGCKDGRVEADCPTCDGSGHVDPYVHPVIKQVIEGQNAYMVKTLESRTICPDRTCHNGTVFITCPQCEGLRVSTAKGKPLHKLTRANLDVVDRIRKLLGVC